METQAGSKRFKLIFPAGAEPVTVYFRLRVLFLSEKDLLSTDRRDISLGLQKKVAYMIRYNENIVSRNIMC